MSEPTYRVYALRYATRNARRQDHFIGGDPHDAPMPMDYFVWAAVNEDRAIVIDTGFTAEVAGRRKRDYLRCPVDHLPSIPELQLLVPQTSATARGPQPAPTASDARANAPMTQRAVRLFDRRTIVSIPGGEP